MEWVLEYPNYVIIRLEGIFYTVKYDAAYLINDICRYNIGYFKDVPMTGSTTYDNMENALIRNCVNYIIVENNEISQKKEFDTSDFKYNLENKYIPKQKAFESSTEMLNYLEGLLNSVDPSTGEILPEDSVINSTEIIEILHFAKQALKKKISAEKNRPENFNKKWTDEEDEQLTKEYENNININEIAKLHQRSYMSVVSRLKKLYPELNHSL